MQNTVPKYICYIYCRKKISGEKQKQTQFNKHLRKVENKSINIIPEKAFWSFVNEEQHQKKYKQNMMSVESKHSSYKQNIIKVKSKNSHVRLKWSLGQNM